MLPNIDECLQYALDKGISIPYGDTEGETFMFEIYSYYDFEQFVSFCQKNKNT